VTPAAFLVHLGEQLHHVSDRVDIDATDAAARRHMPAAATLGHLGPPRAGRDGECGNGVDRTAQNAPAFYVHVAPPEISQRDKGIGTPVTVVSCGVLRSGQPDLVQGDDSSEDPLYGFPQNHRRTAARPDAGGPFRHVRAAHSGEFVRADLNRDADEGPGDPRVRSAGFGDHLRESSIAVACLRHSVPPSRPAIFHHVHR
jgi:hypothetical protein